MPNRPSPPVAAPIALGAVLAALTLLAGCGDEEGGTTGSQATSTVEQTAATTSAADQSTTAGEGQRAGEDAGPIAPPEDVVEDFLVSDDTAEVCENAISPELLESTYGDLSGCRNGRPQASLARSAEVEDLEVGDGTAAATAVPAGGSYDGARVKFELELDGDRWVITKVEADIPVGP